MNKYILKICSFANALPPVKFLMHTMPDKTYLSIQYKLMTGKTMNWDFPQSFDEKIQWLKLLNRDPLLTVCSDRVQVREYVKEKGLGHILNTVYGVYNRAQDVDFNALPAECFLKCNHCSGVNIIYNQNKPFKIPQFIKEFNQALKSNYYYYGREWCYKNISPKIIAEKVLRDKDGNLPMDYKFVCFEGLPRLVFVEMNKCTEEGKHSTVNYRNVYDINFNLLEIRDTRENKNIDQIKKPENFEDMLKYAEILAEPFPFCRVDLYNIEGKIYFGELTFYHGSGYNDIKPQPWPQILGSWINLNSPKIKKNP